MVWCNITQRLCVYLVNELVRSPKKATTAPEMAVTRQPKRSVHMLTNGEERKIRPIARAPTHAVKGNKLRVYLDNLKFMSEICCSSKLLL